MWPFYRIKSTRRLQPFRDGISYLLHQCSHMYVSVLTWIFEVNVHSPLLTPRFHVFEPYFQIYSAVAWIIVYHSTTMSILFYNSFLFCELLWCKVKNEWIPQKSRPQERVYVIYPYLDSTTMLYRTKVIWLLQTYTLLFPQQSWTLLSRRTMSYAHEPKSSQND